MRHFALTSAAALMALIGGAVMPVCAEGPQDQAALAGLSEVKIAFDVKNGDPRALLKELDVIDETRQSLIKQGVKPIVVIAFRGPATKLVQTDQSQIKAEDREDALKIVEKIKTLQVADGVAAMEQCAVAVRLAGTKPENVLPGIKVVGNGWISLSAYQAKGYGYIAPQSAASGPAQQMFFESSGDAEDHQHHHQDQEDQREHQGRVVGALGERQ